MTGPPLPDLKKPEIALPPRFRAEGKKIGPVGDGADFAERLCASTGLADAQLAAGLLQALADGMGAEEPQALARVCNEALAWLESMGPTNALETTLLLQMFVLNRRFLVSSRELGKSGLLPTYEAHANAAVKLSRAFTAQAEAFQKLRSGGKQQVIVKHVYIDARTAHLHAGGGGEFETDRQAHERGQLSPPMLGADQGRYALPTSEIAGEEALQATWRGLDGSAERAGERGLSPRTADQGGDGVSRRPRRAAARGSADPRAHVTDPQKGHERLSAMTPLEPAIRREHVRVEPAIVTLGDQPIASSGRV